VQTNRQPGLGTPGEVAELVGAVGILVKHAQGLDDHTLCGNELEAELAQAQRLQQREFFIKAVNRSAAVCP
jgi:hypothetical protein